MRPSTTFARISRLAVPLAGLLLASVALAQQGKKDREFAFAVRTGVATNTVIESEIQPLKGFDGAETLSVSGQGQPEYRVNGGEWTRTPGPVANAKTLKVRHTSSAAPLTETVSVVTVGDYSTEFRSVTGEADSTPDAFDFGTRRDVEPDTWVESESRTLTGFNTPVAIVAGSGAQYRVGGGDWTAADGTLNPGQALQMRHRTGAEPLEYTQTSLTVGGVTGHFLTRNCCEVVSELSIADAQLDEAGGGLEFTVTVAPAASQAITVDFATADGTATAGADYVPASGTLTIPAGAERAMIVIPVLDDALDEADETFTLGLSNAQNATIAEGLATGTIIDDDEPAAPVARFKVGTGEANHDPKGKVCFGSGSMCSRSADPSVDGEAAFRDHLISKATAITGDNGETFILVTTTNIGYFLAYKAEQQGLNGIYDVRLRIAQATGVPSTNITVVSDHSHNGPDTIGIWGGVSAEYMKITADAVVEAAIEAWQSRRDATIRVASVNGNDDPVPGVPRLDSSYDLPPGNDLSRGNPYNEFRLMTADDAATGERILTFVNYAPHATVTNGDRIDGKYRLTGDWAAWATQEAAARFGGMGLAAIGAVGSTDWNKSGNVAEKEAEARARLNRLMDEATAKLRPVRGAEVQVESTFVREQIAAPIVAAGYKPGLDNNSGLPQDGMDLRIDRSVTPPFLTGSVLGTYVSAIRIGDVFVSTFPGEPFGELDHAIKEEGRVLGAREYFLLGGANDFFGYMVKNRDTYEQTLRTGVLWLPGCPEEDFAKQVGIREEGEGACSDHWTLMVSPTFGSHIVCTLQDAADRLGFQTANRDAECPAFTALDGMAPPPESGSAGVLVSSQGRTLAVRQAQALAEQCRGTAAPAELCEALAQGAQQAQTYLGVGTEQAVGTGQARAGVAVKDASWHLGASAGQFSATGAGIAGGRGFDPYHHSTRKVGSDILGTRITTRALVVEGANGGRIAIASNDLYLPNDLLHRRTAQLLAEHDLQALATGGTVTGITDATLATTSSHSHTSPFYSTPSWGTMIFQDVVDLRFFEYMARQMADAVIEAAATMRPVRMGGATVHANDVQAHTYGPKNVRDGTPAGQPRDYTTQAVTVVSFDDISTGTPTPLANWVVFGVHPEWVWGEEIVNGDITHAVMRMLDRETGAVTVWSQRETGSSGPHKDSRVHDPVERREYQESNFAGYDRAARQLTDSIKRALGQLASNQPERPDQFAPYQTGFEVASSSMRVAPPATRPYPGVSNCNSDRAFEGDVGTPVTGLPDCDYTADEFIDPVTDPFWNALPADPAALARQLNEAGVPVPTSYSATSLTAVQETAAVHLQVFKLGSIAATMSPNEQFTSQALNLESRLDKVPDNIWHGFDWACVAQLRGLLPVDEDPKVRAHCERQNARYPETGVAIPGNLFDEDFPRARAQIHNDAKGWELDPAYAAQSGDTSGVTTLGGEAEPSDIKQIKGNFTHEEFPEHGYDLVVSVGMANDYWGYMAEYREYRAHSDAYRKALNALGPHGADFVATRLARMAANLNGAGVELPFNPLDVPYQAESARAEAFARGMGEAARAYEAAYGLQLPPDGGAPGIVTQPAEIVKRFSAAVLKFVGGSNYSDLPAVRVERLVSGTPESGEWETYGTQEGEVQLQLQFIPNILGETFGSDLGEATVAFPDPQALALWRAGQFEWVWTASFEAFVSELDNLGARPGITPAGTYRFVVDGQHRGLLNFPGAAPYHLESQPFEVVPWDGITVEDLQVEADGRVSFGVGPVNTFTTFKSGAGDGNTTRNPGYTVGPVDYPDSYEGGISWIRNERQLFAGDQQYCGRCSFRPWADSAQLAVSSIPVTVRRADGSQYTLAATRQGGRWSTSGVIADGETAFVAAGTIADEYGEKNGADSATVTRGAAPADRDGDGVPDGQDACPDEAGPAHNGGCPVATDADGDGVADADDACPTQPGPAANNGCPEQASEGFPLCDPAFDTGYCLSDIDAFVPGGIGSALQQAADDAYAALTGGGEPEVVLVDCTGPAGDPAEGTPEFAQRDAANIYCTQERHRDALPHPANNPYMIDNYGADPYRAPARHAGTRFRHIELDIAGIDAQSEMSYDSTGGTNAEIYMPCAEGTCANMPEGLQTFEPPYPVVIVLHGAASNKKHLEWATQPLAEHGYFVLTVNGTGEQIPAILLDWLEKSNPYAAEIDLKRIGITGHSLGAENSTRTQGDSRVAGIVAWDPCDGTPSITECKGSQGSKLHGKGAAARTPTLFLTADYLGFPGYPQPQTSVPGDLRVEGFGILRGNGVDTMLVTPRATTHLDWAGAFTFGNRLNEATSLYYTVAWFDRYVAGKLVVDGAGAVVPTHGRSAGEERAFRQAIVDEAFARLTATHFDGLVDLHNISQGRYDAAQAAASGDSEYGGNVPYRVAGLPLADRLSFYHRSVCFIGHPDLLNGDGTTELARADSTEGGDMRHDGCTPGEPVVDTDGDGVPDAQDAFPDDPAESADSDGDGIGDNADSDDDNDGVADEADACPTQAGEGEDGCPAQAADSFPLCDPFFTDYCITDLDTYVPGGVGGAIQQAANTIYDTLTGDGGGEPEPPSALDNLATALANIAANLQATLEAISADVAAEVATLAAAPANAPSQAAGLGEQVMGDAGVVSTTNPWLRRRPLNISHRGGEQDWPENTMFAYAESIREAGSDMIEMDIYETADGELVVIHDPTVDNTTEGTGSVSSFTLAQLRALDAAYWFAQESPTQRHGTNHNRPESEYIYRGIATGAKAMPAELAALGYGPQDFRIPTLREIFENPRFYGVYINIELKPDEDSTGQYEAKLAALIREYGREDDVIVASFLDHNSSLFKANAPEVSTSVPTAQAAVDKGAGSIPLSPDGTHPGMGFTAGHKAFQVPPALGVEVITAEYVRDAHARGMAVHAWTINDKAEMVRLLNLCVDGIMSDKPRDLEEVLRGNEWSCPLDAGGEGEPLQHFVGSLHEHSGFSDGAVGTSPADYFHAGIEQGLDFVGSSEHSDNARLPVTANTDCLSPDFAACVQLSPDGVRKWDATAVIADLMNEPGSFSAIRGFEWTSDRFGHVNVFFSQNDLNAKSGTGYAVGMEDFWQWLAISPTLQGGADGLAVFNHPGREADVHEPLMATPIGGDPAYTWNDFAYRPEHDARVVGIELYGKGDHYYDGDNGAPAGGWYSYALDKGWHVGPVGAEDEHGTAWATPQRAKTVMLAARNTRAALRAAMQARRFYALAHGHGDIRLDYSADGESLGSRLVRAAGATLWFQASVRDLVLANGVAAARIEVVGPGGAVIGAADGLEHAFSATVPATGESWRFVRVLDAAGKVLAVSAPIWFRSAGPSP